MPKLWLRAGDWGDYNNIDTFQEVAETLGPLGVGTIWRYVRYGVAGDGFAGQNYISLYWGDDNADPIRELTDVEIKEVNRELDRYFQTGEFVEE